MDRGVIVAVSERQLVSGLKFVQLCGIMHDESTFGMRDGKVAWNLFGVSDAELLEKTMRGWLNR